MPTTQTPPSRSSLRQFFMRGLALLLPTILTLILLTWAYDFISNNIAEPINQCLRWVIIWATPFPHITPGHTRVEVLESFWADYHLGLNLIGLIIAVGIILLAGAAVGSFIGRRVQAHGGALVQRLPVFKQIYPSIKQITDMLVGQGDQKIKFHRVVAVEFPRRDSWVIGLVTGPAIPAVHGKMGGHCINVFIPNTPTPISGFVLMVLEKDTIPLDISIEDALRFVVSAGLLLPSAPAPGSNPLAIPGTNPEAVPEAPATSPGLAAKALDLAPPGAPSTRQAPLTGPAI